MNGLFHAGLEVQNFMCAMNWRFCFIGGLAVLRWGESRVTGDVDLSLFVGFGNERPFVDSILKQFPARISDAANFAIQNRVVLIHTSHGVPADISLAALPFEDAAIERASNFEFTPDCILHTCSAEDLIVYKTFAARPKDWIDVEGIITRQSGKLDKSYIFQSLEPLVAARENPEALKRLEILFRRRS